MIKIKDDERKNATVAKIINMLADEQYTVDEARTIIKIVGNNITYMSTVQKVQNIRDEDY